MKRVFLANHTTSPKTRTDVKVVPHDFISRVPQAILQVTIMAERVIRTIIELTRTNLLHSGAPPNMWGECLLMVVHVWNNLATCIMENGKTLSRRNILEGDSRVFDLSTLRAFGTKCFFMLTVQKKGGKKLAMGPKARAGVIIGIEDNMPAYRVLEMNPRGKAHRIPFAQTVTHEGHFPFKDYTNWEEDEKRLPKSFLPSLEAKGR